MYQHTHTHTFCGYGVPKEVVQGSTHTHTPHAYANGCGLYHNEGALRLRIALDTRFAGFPCIACIRHGIDAMRTHPTPNKDAKRQGSAIH
jgi:hypothetical protein